MRRNRAIERLRMIADRSRRVRGLWEEPDDEPLLQAVYTFGELLDGVDTVDVVQLAIVLNLPADELPWCAQPQNCLGLVQLLELDKAPVQWYWRPSVWPVANHVIRRPLRIFSADSGVDEAALEALANRQVESLRLPAPAPEDEAEQLAEELQASLTHLRRVHGEYWEGAWRKAHRGSGIYPESHLWDAVRGYLDLLAATHPKHNTVP